MGAMKNLWDAKGAVSQESLGTFISLKHMCG